MRRYSMTLITSRRGGSDGKMITSSEGGGRGKEEVASGLLHVDTIYQTGSPFFVFTARQRDALTNCALVEYPRIPGQVVVTTTNVRRE